MMLNTREPGVGPNERERLFETNFIFALTTPLCYFGLKKPIISECHCLAAKEGHKEIQMGGE